MFVVTPVFLVILNFLYNFNTCRYIEVLCIVTIFLLSTSLVSKPLLHTCLYYLVAVRKKKIVFRKMFRFFSLGSVTKVIKNNFQIYCYVKTLKVWQQQFSNNLCIYWSLGLNANLVENNKLSSLN